MEPLGGLLGARSSGYVGPFWSRLWGLLGHLGSSLGRFEGLLGCNLALLGASWGRTGDVLGPSWAYLGQSWISWPSCAPPGALSGGLVPIWGPSWGLRIAKLTPLSWARWRSSRMVSYAKRNEASPSLGAANCETDATFVGSWVASGVMSYTDQKEAWPPLGAASCETVAAFIRKPE